MVRPQRVVLIGALAVVPALVMLGTLWLYSGQGRVEKSKFDWLASNSAPAGCPMRIIMGDFHFRGGGSLYIPPASLHGGWGAPASVHVVGADEKPLPDRMTIVFYSYLEDKLYRGDFQLPYERIAKLFAEGYRSYDYRTPPHITFERLIAGVAPGGSVAVWVDGIGREQEVFFGRAQEFDGDWHQITGMPPHVNREENRVRSLNQAVTTDPMTERFIENVPIDVWETYRAPYAWRPVFADVPMPLVSVVYNYFNGERYELPVSMDAEMQKLPRPIPKHIDFFSKIPGEDAKVWFQYDFDEAEITRAFKAVGDGKEPIELVFRRAVRESASTFEVVLRSGERETLLEKTRLDLNRAP